jgi:hypothetical protein
MKGFATSLRVYVCDVAGYMVIVSIKLMICIKRCVKRRWWERKAANNVLQRFDTIHGGNGKVRVWRGGHPSG